MGKRISTLFLDYILVKPSAVIWEIWEHDPQDMGGRRPNWRLCVNKNDRLNGIDGGIPSRPANSMSR